MQEPAALRPGILEAETPRAAVAFWRGEPESLEHISTGASFVYRFTADSRALYLRLTPPGWRSEEALRGEVSLIDALASQGLSVARAVASSRGETIEPVEDRQSEFLAMAFEEAPGRHEWVQKWDESIARRFGRLMAETHAAAPHNLPPGQKRPNVEGEFASIREWLPTAEGEVHAHLDEAEKLMQSLPRRPDVFGLVHYDMCEDNMLWSEGEPTLIDFDDCMFTWFAADIARALASLYAADPMRYEAVSGWWLQGYEAVRALDEVSRDWLTAFITLNAISDLSWCLHARAGGLAIGDAGGDVEATCRKMLAHPGRWSPLDV